VHGKRGVEVVFGLFEVRGQPINDGGEEGAGVNM
jgi:hypothetical protein